MTAEMEEASSLNVFATFYLRRISASFFFFFPRGVIRTGGKVNFPGKVVSFFFRRRMNFSSSDLFNNRISRIVRHFASSESLQKYQSRRVRQVL